MKKAEPFWRSTPTRWSGKTGKKSWGCAPVPWSRSLRKERTGSERVDKFVKFPPGYVEPRHTHDYYHSTLVQRWEMHVGGEDSETRRLRVYGGPDEPTAPIIIPKGCMVYSAGRFRGKLSQTHKYLIHPTSILPRQKTGSQQGEGTDAAGSESFELRVFECSVNHFRFLSITFSLETAYDRSS